MFFTNLLLLLAEAEQATPTTDPGGGWRLDPLTMALPFILLFAYLFLIRPSMRQEQQRQALTKNLKKDDEVLTNGGIYASVVSVHETKDEVVLKVADNTRIRVVKSAVARNLTQEAAQAAEAAKKTGK
jgi:preprotein translocase subunit YajC